MSKVLNFLSYIFSFLKFWGGKEDAYYKLLTFEEIESQGAEGVKIHEVIYKDVIEENFEGKGTSQIKRIHVLRKPFFLVAKNEKEVILNLKKQLYIGPKNYTEYDRVCDENIELRNKLLALEADFKSSREECKTYANDLEYIKRCIGENAFINYFNKRGTNAGQ